jgi:hypothetical protein
MPRIETEVPEELIEWMKKAWGSNRRLMSDEVLRQLGWKDFATFAGDLLRLGFQIASEDPRKFISHVRELKAPIFKPAEGKARSRAENEVDDSLKAYA